MKQALRSLLLIGFLSGVPGVHAADEGPSPDPRSMPARLVAQATEGAPAKSAAPWPVRPLRMIVSFAPGAGPDIICRIVMDRLSKSLGQQVVIENRPGSGNIVGSQAAARLAPDGYNYYFATSAALASNPYTFKSLPYDPARDFVPVGMIAKGPFFVLASPGLPARNLAELAALDKAQPGKLAFATDGPRNFSGMLAAWLNKLMGMRILTVPYANMPQGIQDTLAGRTQLVVLAVPAATAFIRRGELKPLAVSYAKRIPGYDDVPTVAETFPGFELLGWFSVVAPAGTPPEAVQRMNRELDRVLKEPEVSQRIAGLGFYTDGADTPEGFAEFMRAEQAKWAKIVKDIGVQPE